MGSCGRMVEKFNAGTMKVEREALLWCGFQWRRKPRWRPRARKKRDDERAKGVVDGRADPADRRRAIGYRLSGAKRDTVHREAFSGAPIDIHGGKDIR